MRFISALSLYRKAYSKATVLDLIDAAPKEAYKFFDINLRQDYYDKEIICCLLERANILKLNVEELKIIKNLLGLRGYADDICPRLKKQYGLKYVILSDTAKESKIWGENNQLTAVKKQPYPPIVCLWSRKCVCRRVYYGHLKR